MKTLFTIWTKPGKTLDYLDQKNYHDIDSSLNVLYYLGLLGFLIPYVVNKYKVTENYQFAFLIFGVLVGGFLGVLFLKYVYVFLFWIIGRVLQGKATKQQIRIVLAYFMIPGLINLTIALILIIIAIIIKDIEIVGYQNPFTQFVIWIFGIRTLIIGLSKYNAYSYGYAIINIFLVTGLLQGLAYGLKYLTH
jgi:vacuolar-type H+-ATPase subunit I/STV1